MDTNKNNEKQIGILQGQMIGSAAYIVVIIVSIVLLYNQVLIMKGEEGFLSNEEASDINLANRLVILILVLYFLYTNYQNIVIAEEEGRDTKNLNLQFVASILAVVSTIIVLYVTLTPGARVVTAIPATENPNL